ncbi:MAG: CpsB/CapC family capsule biosynthesis tyrosine phosphatase, partial [Limnochordia bacterium]
MIDLHTHILPGVDDGAEDLAMAIEMAEAAVRGGITVVAATPHFFQLPDWGKIKALTAELQRELDRAEIGLKVV